MMGKRKLTVTMFTQKRSMMSPFMFSALTVDAFI